MNAAQINDQLMPRRAPRVGLGASFVTLQPGDSFKMTIDVSQGGNPLLAMPSSLNASGFGGNFTGKYTGTTPYQLFPGHFSYVAAVNYGSAQNPNWQNVTYTYKVLSASATAPAPPPAHVVWFAPPQAPAPGVNVPHPVGVLKGSGGGTTGGSSGSSSTSSSKTPYYVAGAGALALAAGAAYWKYGRKAARR